MSNNLLRDFSEFSGTMHGIAEKTSKMLKDKKISSPQTKNLVEVAKGTWIDCPYTEQSQISAWISEMREKYKLTSL